MPIEVRPFITKDTGDESYDGVNPKYPTMEAAAKALQHVIGGDAYLGHLAIKVGGGGLMEHERQDVEGFLVVVDTGPNPID